VVHQSPPLIPSPPQEIVTVLIQAWLFISPGLYPHERRYAIPFVLSMLVIAGPMLLLYCVGIGVDWAFGKPRVAEPHD